MPSTETTQTYAEALLDRWHELWDLANEARDNDEPATARRLFSEAATVLAEYDREASTGALNIGSRWRLPAELWGLPID
jgi:hypothetical protein